MKKLLLILGVVVVIGGGAYYAYEEGYFVSKPSSAEAHEEVLERLTKIGVALEKDNVASLKVTNVDFKGSSASFDVELDFSANCYSQFITSAYQGYMLRSGASLDEPLDVTLVIKVSAEYVPADKQDVLAVLNLSLPDAVAAKLESAKEILPEISAQVVMELKDINTLALTSGDKRIEKNDGVLDVKGMKLAMWTDSEIDKFGFDFDMPGGSFTLAGQQVFDMQGLKLVSKMRDGAAGLSVGDSNLVLKQIAVDTPDGEKFRLNNFVIDSKSDVSGSNMYGDAAFSLDSLILDDEKIGPAIIRFSMKNFDAKALADIDNMMQQSCGGETDPNAMFAMMGTVTSLLKASPELNFDEISVATSTGNLEGFAKFRFDVSGEVSIMDPTSLTNNFKANAEIKASKEMIRKIMTQSSVDSIRRLSEWSGEKKSEQQIQQEAEQAAALQISQMEQQGFISSEGDKYVLTFEFKDGAPMINGKAVPFF